MATRGEVSPARSPRRSDAPPACRALHPCHGCHASPGSRRGGGGACRHLVTTTTSGEESIDGGGALRAARLESVGVLEWTRPCFPPDPCPRSPFPCGARPRQTPDQTRRKKALQGARAWPKGARGALGRSQWDLGFPQIPAPHFPSCEHQGPGLTRRRRSSGRGPKGARAWPKGARALGRSQWDLGFPADPCAPFPSHPPRGERHPRLRNPRQRRRRRSSAGKRRPK